jgi:hypothetical protein
MNPDAHFGCKRRDHTQLMIHMGAQRADTVGRKYRLKALCGNIKAIAMELKHLLLKRI